jgi:hypothetical protein
MENFDGLFDGGLDAKMDFLNEKTTTNNDGIYRIDLKLVKDKKRGYRSVVRFLPNLLKDGKIGQSALEKISHFVNIKNPKELSGFFDSPKNFGEKYALSDFKEIHPAHAGQPCLCLLPAVVKASSDYETEKIPELETRTPGILFCHELFIPGVRRNFKRI